MNISVKRTTGKSPSRPVIVVSKKIAKKATDRNLLRRRIRAIVRPFAAGNSSFFIIAKPGVLDLSFKELQNEIESQIRNKK